MTNRFRSPRRVFFVSWTALMLLSALWAIATPISASPDEPAHFVKAASVVRGEFIGAATPEGNLVQVPTYVAWTNARTCFAYEPTASAACAPPVPGDPFESFEIGTRAGLYNPIYYLLVGWPSLLFQNDLGLYAMRLVSALLTTAFSAAAFALVSTWRRPVLPTVALVALATPMLLFLTGSLNPNALETTATLAVFVAMLSIVTEPDPSSLKARIVILVVSAVLAVNARGLSPIWVVLALLVPLLLPRWRDLRQLLLRPPVLVSMGGVAVGTLFALAWLGTTNSLGAAVTDPDAENIFPGAGDSFATGFRTMIIDTFGFGGQLIGLFGWADTPAPAGVLFVYAVVFGLLILLGLSLARGRALIGVLVLLGAFILIPPVIQGVYVTEGGYIWQGRYNFPLFALALFASAALVPGSAISATRVAARRLSGVGLSTLAVAHLSSFWYVLQRYASGTEVGIRTSLLAPEWSAPGGNILLIVLFAIVLAATSFVVLRHLSALTQSVAEPVVDRVSEAR